MRYTKAILAFSFLAVSLIFFGQEQKLDVSKQATGRPSITITNRTWFKETVVYEVYFQGFKNEIGGLKRIISKLDHIKIQGKP